MTPSGIRERFNLYRKWFQTFLIKEFMNLPLKSQENFIYIAEKFLADCRRILEESRKVQEKQVRLTVDDIFDPKEGDFVTLAVSGEFGKSHIKAPVASCPKIGSSIIHVMYSIDGSLWYTSKENLIKGR